MSVWKYEQARADSNRWMYEDWDREDALMLNGRKTQLAGDAYKHSQHAWMALQMGMPDMAVRIARDEVDGSSALARNFDAEAFLRARRYMDDELYSPACAELDIAINHDGFNGHYYFLRGVCLYCLKEFERATEDFLQAKINNVSPAMCHSYRGLCNKAMGEFLRAESEFKLAIGAGADNADVYFHRGVCRLELRDYTGAVSNFETAVEMDANAAHFHYMLGLSRVLAVRLRPAVQAFEQAEALGWRRATLYAWRADAYFALGEEQAAERDLEEAVSMEPNLSMAHNLLGRLHRRRGDLKKATRHFTEEIRLRPKKIGGYLERGGCHMRVNDLPAALADLSRAHEMAPKSPRPLFHLADCLLRMDRAEEALAAVVHSLRFGPGHLSARMLEVYCLVRLNRWEPAREKLEAVIAQDDRYPAVHYHLGRVLEKVGDREGAIRELGIDIEQNPNQGMPYLIRGELQEQLGRSVLAVKDFKQATILLEASGWDKERKRAMAGLERVRS